MKDLMERLSGLMDTEDRSQISEGYEIERKDLVSDIEKKVKVVEKSFLGKATQFFDTNSGTVVIIKLNSPGRRIHNDDLGKIFKNVRWIDVGNKGEVSVGI